MGGAGSGRYDYARTATVRESCRIVSDWFSEAIHADDGAKTTLSWEGDVSVGVVLEVVPHYNDADRYVTFP